MGVVGAMLIPIWVALGAIAALAADYRVEVEKTIDHRPSEGHMKSRLVLLAGAVALVSCGSGIRVSTMVAPSANLSGLTRFRVLHPPSGAMDGGTRTSDAVNSITNNALHADLEQAFRSRGYTLDPRNPDFNVAYYSSAREKLDVTMWELRLSAVLAAGGDARRATPRDRSPRAR